MILSMDVGNTNIKTALFDGKEMFKYWRMSTNIHSTSDEYGVRLMASLNGKKGYDCIVGAVSHKEYAAFKDADVGAVQTGLEAQVLLGPALLSFARRSF